MLKLRGPEQTERGLRLGGPEQKLGLRARAGSVEARGLEDAAFYNTCTVPKHQALSALCQYRSRIAAFFDQNCMRLTKSAKDRKKGYAYDPVALYKQGALKNQTLPCTSLSFSLMKQVHVQSWS